MKNENNRKNDVSGWIYSDVVKDHFLHPRYFIEGKEPPWRYDAVGEVGSPACGDVMRIWLKINKVTAGNRKSKIVFRISKVGWKTFGCASAIASTSILAEMLMDNGGMTLEQAKKITARDIVNKLGGLPPNKIHCSVLGDQALQKAILDFEVKNCK